MIDRRVFLGVPRLGLLVLVVLLLQTSTVLAQGLVDPVARARATELFPVYRQAVASGRGDTFNAAFTDAVTTRKVFITALQYSGEQWTANRPLALEWYGYAKALVGVIATRFGDNQPQSITAVFDTGDFDRGWKMVYEYALPLYPELATRSGGFIGLDPATQKYGQFELIPMEWEPAAKAASYELYWVFLRIQLAQGYSCFEQGITQARLASRVLKKDSDYVAQHGNDKALQNLLAFFQTGMDAFRIAIVAETGLLDEATAELPDLLKRPEHRGYRSAVLLSCARTALQQGKTAQAEGHLQEANRLLQGLFTPPPLKFALLTAEYQLRRQKGYRPLAAQRAADFKAVWDEAFAGYRPFQRVQADAYWYYGRKATRYWLAELEPGLPETEKVTATIYTQLVQWFDKLPYLYSLNPSATQDDWFFNPEHTGNYLSALMSLTDVWVALAEILPPDSPQRSAFVAAFEPMLDQGQAWAGECTEKGANGFSVVDSGLLPEMRGRLNLIKAQETQRSAQDRIELANGAPAFVTKSGDPEATLQSLLSAGKLLQGLGRPDLAVAKWKEALALAERLNYVLKATQAASMLADELGRQKKWQEASLYADKASQGIQESMILVYNDPKAARELGQTSDKVTEVSVKAAVQANDPQKALAALVRGKETQSATSLARGGSTDDAAQAEVAAVKKQQQEVATLSVEVQKLESLPSSPERDAMLGKTEQLLAATKQEFLLKVRGLRQKYPDLYSRMLKFDPLDLPDVQRQLLPEMAVIQYFPTEDGLYIFVVTQKDFRLRSVPVNEEELSASVASYVRAIRRFQPGDTKMEAESKSLYASLIAPCLADIEGKSTLVLIPTGRLNILPFASLSDPNGKPLIESNLLLEMAKPTDFDRIAKNPPRKVESVVAFANATGDLPAAAKEGEEIAKLFPGSKLFEGKEATKRNFFDFGGQAQVLHLATHGESNSEDSLANYLRMTGDEKVAQEEIFGLSLENTSIVTLSACNTAVGDNTDSKFVASLAEAFWLGGSQSVIASLWAVNDASTGLLMTELYRGLREGKGRAQALREAQLKVRATPGFEHPYFWAGFLLFGDGR